MGSCANINVVLTFSLFSETFVVYSFCMRYKFPLDDNSSKIILQYSSPLLGIGGSVLLKEALLHVHVKLLPQSVMVVLSHILTSIILLVLLFLL